MATPTRQRVILDVDTGTDDAGALLLAATHPCIELDSVSATWGNCSRDQVAVNTALVLRAAHHVAAVHLGTAGSSGPSPFDRQADEVMGGDGLCGIGQTVGVPTPAVVERAGAAESIVQRANDSPGAITLVALAPLTTIASALDLDPGLPGRLAGFVVMGGALAVGGNVTAAAESNIAHDPEAAAKVIASFGAPGAMPHGVLPRLVPLDVTRPAALTRRELDALAASEVPGAGLVHRIFAAAWPTGLLETGRADVWPAHDLLAAWCVVDPGVCEWESMPLAVDLGGHAAWGATIGDRSLARKAAWRDSPDAADWIDTAPHAPNRWAVAMRVDANRFHAGLRAWLAGAHDEDDEGQQDRRADFVH